MPAEDRIAQFQKLVDQNPNDELAQFSLGSALLEAGRPAEAGPCFQRVLALNSQSSKAYQLLGESQLAAGNREFAIQTFTNGYRIAHRKGDLMPANAMKDQLAKLGAPVPEVAEKSSTSPSTADAGTGFTCRRCSGRGPQLASRPFKGPLGEKILATVCGACWKEWVGMGTKVINELRLPMFDPQAQETYDKHMKEFLLLD